MTSSTRRAGSSRTSCRSTRRCTGRTRRGGTTGRDSHGSDPTPYTGPVPLVTHVHGNHTFDYSDGYAEAWFLPDASDIPPGYATTGSFYEFFRASSPYGAQWGAGNAVFDYPNDQRATTLWYHDHALGMTRLNVYAGPAGFYLLRGGPDDLHSHALPEPPYEIPIAIQDRSFNDDGSLFFPGSREFFDEFDGPYIGDPEIESDIS